MDFEARVWDCDGGDSEAVRDLHFGNRSDNSKKREGGLKVLIFHYVPQSHKATGRNASGFLIARKTKRQADESWLWLSPGMCYIKWKSHGR